MTEPDRARPRALTPADLERVRSEFGVATEQVRRDHALSHVLAAIAATPEAGRLVFFGGTALSRTLLPRLRLSEDIDLLTSAPRAGIARVIEGGIADGLRRSHGHATWSPSLAVTKEAESGVLVLDGGIRIRIQLLGASGYPRWPSAFTPLEQRYADAPAAVLPTLTAPAFAASKALAWADRGAERDLYDLWGLASGGHVDAEAADLLRRHGPTARPDPARMFATAPSPDAWSAALDHQCIVRVGATEALDCVRQSWVTALSGA